MIPRIVVHSPRPSSIGTRIKNASSKLPDRTHTLTHTYTCSILRFSFISLSLSLSLKRTIDTIENQFCQPFRKDTHDLAIGNRCKYLAVLNTTHTQLLSVSNIRLRNLCSIHETEMQSKVNRKIRGESKSRRRRRYERTNQRRDYAKPIEQKQNALSTVVVEMNRLTSPRQMITACVLSTSLLVARSCSKPSLDLPTKAEKNELNSSRLR